MPSSRMRVPEISIDIAVGHRGDAGKRRRRLHRPMAVAVKAEQAHQHDRRDERPAIDLPGRRLVRALAFGPGW